MRQLQLLKSRNDMHARLSVLLLQLRLYRLCVVMRWGRYLLVTFSFLLRLPLLCLVGRLSWLDVPVQTRRAVAGPIVVLMLMRVISAVIHC